MTRKAMGSEQHAEIIKADIQRLGSHPGWYRFPAMKIDIDFEIMAAVKSNT